MTDDAFGPTLAIDSSGDRMAAAAFDADGVVPASIERPTARGEADCIVDIANEVFRRGFGAWRPAVRIVVVAGPGAFTGVRASVAAARGFALATGGSAIGVDGFDAIAGALWREGVRADHVGVCFGRPDRLAWRPFELGDRGARALDETLRQGDAAALAHAGATLLAGPDATSARVVADLLGVTIARPSAVAVLRSAVDIARAGSGDSPPKPIYARPPDAAPPSDLPPPRLQPPRLDGAP